MKNFLLIFAILFAQNFLNAEQINFTIPKYLAKSQNGTPRAANVYLNGNLNVTNGHHWSVESLFSYGENTADFSLLHLLKALPKLTESLPVNSPNQLCAKHSRYVLEKANDFELWALQMLDSTGKLSSGLLRGNINQLGDFDQCIGVEGMYRNESNGKTEGAIRGKYCLAAVDFTLPPSLRTIDNLVHSHHIIRSKPGDPYHRIPKFTSMYWAVCVPDSCSSKDVKHMIDSQVEQLRMPGLTRKVSVEDYNCHTKKQTNISFGTLLALLFFTAVICFVAITTLLDYEQEKPTKPGDLKTFDILVQSFSLKRNLRRLLDLDGPPDDVACLHGIRALNALALLASHKCMQLLFYPYVNRTQMTELISYPWSMMGRSAIVYTDSFVLISGCLAAQSFLKIFDRKQNKIINSYISRFLRLTPNLAAIILFCTFILPLLGSGPLWNNVITRHSDLCQKNWWKNILYVHNYFGFEEMCLTHTHQLGIDMQLYVVSPLLIYLLWKYPFRGIVASILISAVSTYLRYFATLKNNLSPVIYFGVSVSQLFNTASLSYILPTHRATVYVMGILLGYYIHYHSRTPVKISHGLVNFGSFLATVIGFLAMYGSYWMADRNYRYSAKEMALYMAFTPIAWCLALIWGIFINVNGHTGRIGEFFKWRGFRVFTRIAYALYLVQFPVYFYNVGTTRAPRYFTSQILFNIEEYAIIFGLSAILTLVFDLPFQNMTKLLKLKSWKPQVQQKSENEKVK